MEQLRFERRTSASQACAHPHGSDTLRLGLLYPFQYPPVKNLPVMQETGVRSLGQEDALEKGMATHSSILAWRIPWTESCGLESV